MAGKRKAKIVAIQFDIRDWENGFWFTFQIPYSEERLEAVMAMPNSACIELIEEPAQTGHTSQ